MNVCFAIGTLSYSGAEKIMYNLLIEFQKRKHNVSVMLLSCEKPYDFLDNIAQYPIYNSYDDGINNRFIRVIKRKNRIRNVIATNRFDVIVSFGSKFNVDIADACRFLNVKLILCERNDPVNDPKSKLLRIRRCLSYRRGNGFVFQTETIQSFFSSSIQKKSVVIPNFIEKKPEYNVIHNHLQDRIATCGRLDDNQKNQTSLIKTFLEFRKTHPDYVLDFYGDGPDKEKYEHLIKDLGLQGAVFLHGRINEPMKEITKCKMFVFTSKFEGMPNALIEAMSYGMPCIATDCGGGGAKALISTNENGLLIPYGDEEELLNAMLKLASDSEFANRLGQEAYKINDRLAMEKIIPIWEHYIQSVCGVGNA